MYAVEEADGRGRFAFKRKRPQPVKEVHPLRVLNLAERSPAYALPNPD
jgi:hypothetical protein